MRTHPAVAASPDIGVNVGLLVASATAPGTFASSLAPRSSLDQGLVTALSTGLHYLLTLGAQDALQAVAELAAAPDGSLRRQQRTLTVLADLAAVRSASASIGLCRRGPANRFCAASSGRSGGGSRWLAPAARS
jgi:hypothetical protein